MVDFKIRSYGKSELALLYRPNVLPSSALKTLNNWIHRNRDLEDALLLSGYNPTSRSFTPLQVKILVEYLGEP